MAVQGNVQATAVSSSVLQNSVYVPTVQTVSANGVIQTILPAASGAVDTKPTIHQLRLVQALPSSSAGNHQQSQIVRIIKHTPDGVNVSSANIINVRAPSPSPIKAGTVITIPHGTTRVLTHQGTTRVLTHQGAKLKVGDTITIPKASLLPDKATTNLAPAQTAIASTPSKLISASAPNQSPVIIHPATSTNVNIPNIQMTNIIHPNSSFTHQIASPDRLTTISPSWAQSPLRYKRPSVFVDSAQSSDSKRRRTPNSNDKGSKGLRHFAMLVCEKVKQKVTTTYNEVADELVAEYSDSRHISEQHYDQKNIRRRVYDALNVLMAMDIIYKDKKDIHWVGLPTNSAQEVQSLQSEKKKREQRIQQKTLQLQELILQQIAFKNLVQRNKRLQQTQGPPPDNSSIQLPFIIVNTSKKTVIDCSISNDKYEYMFNFDNTFEIHDDIEVLKRMGMAYGLEAGTCSRENLKTAQTLVPPVLKPYLEQMAGYSKDSAGSQNPSAMKYTLQDAPRIVPQGSYNDPMEGNLGAGGIKVEPDTLELGSCFTMGNTPDPDDQEVAMVTDGSQLSSNSSGIAMGFTSSSRSSSSGLHSAMLSLTPLSSGAESESRGSTPMDPYEI